MAMASGSRSLTAKLSYLMTFVVMVTVSALTWQSANKFSAYILQTIEENSTSSAETAAADISSTIEKWLGQITVTASKLSGAKVDANNNDTDLAAALRNDKDLLVIHLYSVDSGNLKLIRQTLPSQRKKPSKPPLNRLAILLLTQQKNQIFSTVG